MSDIENFFKLEDQKNIAHAFKSCHPKFDDKTYIKKIVPALKGLPLKDRMHKTVDVLTEQINLPYAQMLDYLWPVAPKLKGRFAAMLFPDYVEKHGMHDFGTSMDALEYFTSFCSSEFAVRPFLIQDFDKAFPWFLKWTGHKDEHVRRLASEGLRPRLPWSMKIPSLINDPSPSFEVLGPLLKDESLYVRKSVGNHINDIAKDNAEQLFPFFNQLDTAHPHTKWIIKHGLRTLIKDAHPKAFNILGFTNTPKVELESLSLSKPSIKMGETINFEFSILSKGQKPQKLAIDYILYLMKKNGKQSEKVFKFREVDLKPGEAIDYNGKQSFKPLSTRKYYKGEHAIEIMINGNRLAKKTFELKT